MMKLLADISDHVVNFRALRDVVQKEEVAVDYRDLEYLEKLEFVDGVEPPLEFVTQMVQRAKDFLFALEEEYAAIKNKENAGAEIGDINRRLRESEDL